jgi:hypothetical protein
MTSPTTPATVAEVVGNGRRKASNKACGESTYAVWSRLGWLVRGATRWGDVLGAGHVIRRGAPTLTARGPAVAGRGARRAPPKFRLPLPLPLPRPLLVPPLANPRGGDTASTGEALGTTLSVWAVGLVGKDDT